MTQPYEMPVNPEDIDILRTPNQPDTVVFHDVERTYQPIDETEEKALEAEPGAVHVLQSSWDAIVSEVNRREKLTVDELHSSTGLDLDLAKAYFAGMQKRGLIATKPGRDGTYYVWHSIPQGKESIPYDQLQRRIGFVAAQSITQGGQTKRHFGYTGRKWTGRAKPERTPEKSKSALEDSNIPYGVVIVDSLLNHPKELLKVEREAQAARTGREADAQEINYAAMPEYAPYFNTDNLRQLDQEIGEEIRRQAHIVRQAKGLDKLPADDFKHLTGQVRLGMLRAYTGGNVPIEVLRQMSQAMHEINNPRTS